MTEHVSLPPPGALKDRSIGLVLFGAVELLIGVLCALLIPLMLLSVLAGPAGGATVSVRTMIPAAAFYLFAAVAFCWIGVGSILARRWARALSLVISWLWLICGIFSMVFLAVLMPGIVDAMAQQAPPGQQIPSEMIPVMGLIIGATSGCLYVILPGALVLFYQGRNVKATCEFRNPQPCWTDRCPLPVLALSVLMAGGAYAMICTAPTAVLPLFGVLISGVPGAVVCLIFAGLFGWLAWGTYKLRIGAWWATLGLMVVGGLSGVITFAQVDMIEMYRQMDMPAEQVEMIQRMGITDKPFLFVSMAIGMAVWLGYLLFLRRYFVAPAAPAATWPKG